MRVLKRIRLWVAAGVVVALYAAALSISAKADMTLARTIFDIDAYPIRTPVTGCADPLEPKPGVADFRAMILAQVGGGDDGLAVCKRIANASGAYSDHADGRAWDWHVDAASATDRAMVDRVLDWLLRTDERGNRNAMARRLGILYIIWNHQYYRVSPGARWVPYTATADPHDTHVHFSFSLAGALRKTTWWSERPLAWYIRIGPVVPISFGVGAQVPLAGDWDGDGRDTIGVYDMSTRRFSMRDAASSGDPDWQTPPVGPFGAIPLTGNWDGTGGDDVGVYEPLSRRFSFYTRDGQSARPSQVFGADGALPIVGDWDGDGVDDIGTYTPASQTFALLMPDGTVRTEIFGAARDTPIAGDWNGDGHDDIGAFRMTSRTFLYPALSAGEGREVQSVSYGRVRHLPVIGDWDGDGTDEEGIVTAD